MEDFYTRLEQGKISPIMFWKEDVSTWSWMEQIKLEIELIGKYEKEEREGRYGSDLHKYAKQLAEFISLQSNIQRTEREQESLTTNADEPQMPEILKHPEIRKEFDKAIEIGLLKDDYTLKAPKWLIACFCWGICKQYDKGTKAKSGKDKGGFVADWTHFTFIKDAKGKSIDLKLNWQNTKNNNYNPQKLRGFTFWKSLCKELYISE